MKRTFTLAICFSIVLHATFVGLLIWLSLSSSGGWGSEAVVEVSLTESAGTRGQGREPLTSSSPPTIKTGQDGGGGVGSGSGESIGEGRGGDPTLATIWKKVNAAKFYPSIAKHQHLEGTPRISFEIGTAGQVVNATVVTSSGSALLDDAALETVRRAAPLPHYASPITIALRYSLGVTHHQSSHR